MIETLAIKHWTIYKLTNPEGGVYIGRTCNLRKRLYKYANLKEPGQRLLHASLLKHGYENHKLELIETFENDKEYADGKEIFWIRTYMSNWTKWKDINEKGLNLCEGGSGSIGAKWNHSDETKKKMSEKRTGIPNYKARGIKRSDEFKQNLSNKAKGHKRNVGRPMPTSTRIALIKSVKGIKKSAEVVEKNRLALTALRGKAIQQFDLDGNLLNEFPSVNQTKRELNISATLIRDVLKGKRKYTRGYFFKYK